MEEFKRQLKSLTGKLKEAENRAEYAEKTVKKLQKEVDRLEGRFFGTDPKSFVFQRFFFSLEKILKHSFETTNKQEIFTQLLSLERNTLLRGSDGNDRATIVRLTTFA